MANCSMCGAFCFTGTVCALCANTLPAKPGWGTGGTATPRATSTTVTYTLSGTLAGARYDKADTSFFDTVTFGKDGSLENIWNGRYAYHRTRPHANFTVVYTRDAQGNALIIGTGNHGSSNKIYSIDFDTGKTLTCTRK